MGRLISGLIFLALFLIVAGGILLFTMAPQLLSWSLGRAMKVSVEVKRIAFSKDEIACFDLIIDNPRKCVLPTALSCKKITMTAPYSNYFHNHTIINEIDLDGVYLTILMKTKNQNPCNWDKIFHAMEAKEAHAPSFFKNKQVTVKKLLIRNLDVTLVISGKAPITVPTIQTLEVDNIESNAGFPVEVLTHAITKKLVGQVFSMKTVKSAVTSLVKAPLSALQFFTGPMEGQIPITDPCGDTDD